ncbi:YjbF family lipoprotein [Photobacterium sp. SDRW27]|uniref:YjbF family lipoprotein n=1 Tax=Photobacterium obscurum TaxID=2829490 RepID=UPI002244CFFD|nr:YjbF family lipoprotein [Photobacterium obscurum]MCW8328221.1 YjbF family lipoprotein [Photobacterium obscurum]
MQLLQRLILLVSVVLISTSLTGCSQKFNDVNDTMKLAILGDADAELNADDITSLPYASIYARIDDGPQAFMVLALAEPSPAFGKKPTNPKSIQPTVTQLKWLSSDSGMLVTEHGRLVKTLNLPQGNLIETESIQPDPLQLGLHLSTTPLTWQRQIDWQPGYHYGYTLTSTFTRQDDAVVMINQHPVEVIYVTETVMVNDLDINYQNEFWLDPKTGKVLKSRQKIAPGLPSIDITLLKPYS